MNPTNYINTLQHFILSHHFQRTHARTRARAHTHTHNTHARAKQMAHSCTRTQARHSAARREKTRPDLNYAVEEECRNVVNVTACHGRHARCMAMGQYRSRAFCWRAGADLWSGWTMSWLVGWCFEPTQPHRVITIHQGYRGYSSFISLVL